MVFTNYFVNIQNSQNDASLEPLLGSHVGYRDTDKRMASAKCSSEVSLEIGSCEASLRLSADN